MFRRIGTESSKTDKKIIKQIKCTNAKCGFEPFVTAVSLVTCSLLYLMHDVVAGQMAS